MTGASGTAALRKTLLALVSAVAVRFPMSVCACARCGEEEKEADAGRAALLQAAVSCAGTLSGDCREDGEAWETVGACVWAGKATALMGMSGLEGEDSVESLELLGAVLAEAAEAVAETRVEADAEAWHEAANEAVVSACGHLAERPGCDKAWAALGYAVAGDAERSSLAANLGLEESMVKTETAKAVWAVIQSAIVE